MSPRNRTLLRVLARAVEHGELTVDDVREALGIHRPGAVLGTGAASKPERRCMVPPDIRRAVREYNRQNLSDLSGPAVFLNAKARGLQVGLYVRRENNPRTPGRRLYVEVIQRPTVERVIAAVERMVHAWLEGGAP